MKLLNQSLKYLSVSILFIVTVWSAFFYFNLISEIKDNTDDGLENHKSILIENARRNPAFLSQKQFGEYLYSARKIDKAYAVSSRDSYKDTAIHIREPDENKPDLEPMRMLTTTFDVNGEYYELKVVSSILQKDELADNIFWNVIWLYLILITGIIFINNRVLRKIWKPFYDFLNQLKTYRLEHAHAQKLPEVTTNTWEFADMQKAVNSLLLNSITTFEQQKEFIGNASHELQTPLAIALNKLELLLENQELQEIHAEKIVDVYQIIERLIRLNKSLLLLSKIENKQLFDNRPVSINEVVRKTLNDLEDRLTFKNVKCTLSQQEALSVHMDPALANIIVSNLLKNAVFHNIENGPGYFAGKRQAQSMQYR